jgi:L-seryl-tRNA(Ser) seleniumtransferase
MRALRPDKITIAALGATLLHYVRGEAEREIPVWRMIGAQAPELEARARAWRAQLPAVEGVLAGVEPAASTIGGGALPGETQPTYVLALHGTRRAASWASATAAALRAGTPPVVARIEDDRVLLDPRTVLPEQDAPLVAALGRVISSQ